MRIYLKLLTLLMVLSSISLYAQTDAWYLKNTAENRSLYYGYRFQSASETKRLVSLGIKLQYQALQSKFNTSSQEYNNENIERELNEYRRKMEINYADIEKLVQGIDPSTSSIPAPVSAVTNLLKLSGVLKIPVTVLESIYVSGKLSYDLATRSSRMQNAEEILLDALSEKNNSWGSKLILGMELSRLAKDDPILGKMIDLTLGDTLGVSIYASADEILNSDAGLRALMETLDLERNTSEEFNTLKKQLQMLKEKAKQNGEILDDKITQVEELLLASISNIKEKEKSIRERTQEIKTYTEFEQAFSELSSSQFMMTQLIALFNPEVAKQFSQISETFISISHSVIKLQRGFFSKNETPFSIAVQAMGNVFSLVNFFLSGPSSDPFQQMTTLFKALNERMIELNTLLHNHLNVIHEDLLDGFYEISKIMQKGFATLHLELQENKELLGQIQNQVSGLEDWIRYEDVRTSKESQDEYITILRSAVNNCIGVDGNSNDPSAKDSHLGESIKSAYVFATQNSKIEAFMRSAPTEDFNDQYYHRVLTPPYLDENLRQIMRLSLPETTIRGINSRDILNLANPWAWSVGSHVFLDMLKRWPDKVSSLPDKEKDFILNYEIEKLIQTGNNIQQGLTSLFYEVNPAGSKMAVRKSLILRLIKNYVSALHKATLDLESKRKELLKKEGNEDMDVWKSIYTQNLDPQKLKIEFLNLDPQKPKDDHSLGLRNQDALTSHFSQLIPPLIALASRLDLGKIQVSFHRPRWFDVEIRITDRSNTKIPQRIGPPSIVPSSYFYRGHEDYEISAYLGFDVQVDFISDQNILNLGNFSVRTQEKSTILNRQMKYSFIGDDIIEFPSPHQIRWETTNQQNPHQMLSNLLNSSADDLFLLIFKQVLHVNPVWKTRAISIVNNSGSEASEEYKNKILEPILEQISTDFKSYGGGTWENPTLLNMLRIIVDPLSIPKETLDPNNPEHQKLYLLENTRILYRDTSTPPNIIPLVDKLETRFTKLSDYISQAMIGQFDNDDSVERLNGQYALLEAFLSLGLSHSMKTDGALQSFFHPYSSKQLVHGKHLARSGYRNQIWSIGIRRIKVLTALLLGQTFGDNLHDVFSEDPELNKQIKDVTVRWEGFPFILKEGKGLLQDQLSVDESPEIIRETLIRLELFKATWN